MGFALTLLTAQHTAVKHSILLQYSKGPKQVQIANITNKTNQLDKYIKKMHTLYNCKNPFFMAGVLVLQTSVTQKWQGTGQNTFCSLHYTEKMLSDNLPQPAVLLTLPIREI